MTELPDSSAVSNSVAQGPCDQSDMGGPRPAVPDGIPPTSAVWRAGQLALALPECELRGEPLQLSDRHHWPHEETEFAPIFTFGPNPNFGDILRRHTKPKPVSDASSTPIAAGKNTYVYDAHTYHTKVPPQGIRSLIEHYTREGDVVLDPFCGSGMTGVAARECGRQALLSDLSPAAAFIAFNLVTPVGPDAYLEAIHALIREARGLEHDLYDTDCRVCGRIVPMLYSVWSFGVICGSCGAEVVVWDVARDERASVRESKVLSSFACPHCDYLLVKRNLKRTRRHLVQVGYTCCERGPKEQTAPPNDRDLSKVGRIQSEGVPGSLWYPTDEFPPGINTRQPIAAGITTVDRAYTPRALWALAYLWDSALRWPDATMRSKLLFTLTSLYRRVTLFSEFRFWGGSSNTANFNVPIIVNEQNVFRAFERKANTISWYFREAPQHAPDVRVSVQSACHLTQIQDKTVDYILTDPPFGGNINYSEMNCLWESWLRVRTETEEEAIVNKVQQKGMLEYQSLLCAAFSEMRRVLKDGAWMTIVFHNSSAEVWRALQNALTNAGLTVEGTQTFDKKHGTFKQFVSANAVGYDLVLHCRKGRPPGLPSVAREDGIANVRAFVRGALGRDRDQYRTRFLHVSRDDEFDYRRLYAEWLAKAVSNVRIAVSFEDFRGLVDSLR